ncbi:MAG: efflux RND transporter periplasmic adaptor subunit, partial [Anaerolineae bacterium]
AFDPGRDWEQYIDEPSCFEGQGGPVPCTGPFYSSRIKNERENAPRILQSAQESLEVARAQYSLALAGVNNDTAVSANASVVSAQQALEQATTGPKESEIDAARLQIEQAEISLEQSRFSLQQAQDALAKAQLTAPWAGTVLSVDISPGAMVGAGTPIISLLDMHNLQFHTNNLSERDLAQISSGQPVEIVLKSYPNDPITGSVAGIAPQATGTVGDAAVFTVKINLDASDLDLRPGMTGRAEITNDS